MERNSFFFFFFFLASSWMSFSLVSSQSQISQVLCGDYNITFTFNEFRCLATEKTYHVNNIWIGCWPNDDTQFIPTNNIVASLCNGGNAVFLSSLPNQKITCGTHTITVAPDSLCRSSEYLITLDSVYLSCVSQDDSYLNDLTNLLQAWCQEGESYIVS